MQLLEAPFLPQLQQDSPMDLVSRTLDTLPRQAIDTMAWSDPSEKPDVAFAIGNNKSCRFLKYSVK